MARICRFFFFIALPFALGQHIQDHLLPSANENFDQIGIDHGGSLLGPSDYGLRQKVISVQTGSENLQSTILKIPATQNGDKVGGVNQRGRHGNALKTTRPHRKQWPLNMKGKRLKVKKNKAKNKRRNTAGRVKKPKMRQPTGFEPVDLSSFDFPSSVRELNAEQPTDPFMFPGLPVIQLSPDPLVVASEPIPLPNLPAVGQINQAGQPGVRNTPVAELSNFPDILNPINQKAGIQEKQKASNLQPGVPLFNQPVGNEIGPVSGQQLQNKIKNLKTGKGMAKNKRKDANRKLNKKPKMRKPKDFRIADVSSFGSNVKVINEGQPMDAALLPLQSAVQEHASLLVGGEHIPIPLAEPLGSDNVPVAEPPNLPDSLNHQDLSSGQLKNNLPLTVIITPTLRKQARKSGLGVPKVVKLNRQQTIVVHAPDVSQSGNNVPQIVFEIPKVKLGKNRNLNRRKKIQRRGRKLFRKIKRKNKAMKRKEPKVREPKKFVPVDLSSINGIPDQSQERTTNNIPEVEPIPNAEPPNIENIPGFGMIDWGYHQNTDLAPV